MEILKDSYNLCNDNRYNKAVILNKVKGTSDVFELKLPDCSSYRVIGDAPMVEAVDPSGGPYMAQGLSYADFIIRDIMYINKKGSFLILGGVSI